VQFQVCLCEFIGGRINNEAGFYPNAFGFALPIILPPLLSLLSCHNPDQPAQRLAGDNVT